MFSPVGSLPASNAPAGIMPLLPGAQLPPLYWANRSRGLPAVRAAGKSEAKGLAPPAAAAPAMPIRQKRLRHTRRAAPIVRVRFETASPTMLTPWIMRPAGHCIAEPIHGHIEPSRDLWKG